MTCPELDHGPSLDLIGHVPSWATPGSPALDGGGEHVCVKGPSGRSARHGGVWLCVFGGMGCDAWLGVCADHGGSGGGVGGSGVSAVVRWRQHAGAGADVCL